MKVYPKFGKTNDRFYDIALLKLALDLQFNRIMGPVCIPERDFDVTKQPLMVAGWGETANVDDVPPVFRSRFLLKQGDSGGPMTLKDERGRSTIVGIVSYGVICNPSFTSKYTRVAYYTRWIKNMLNHPGKWTKLQFDRKIQGIRLNVKPV
ncbi:hypothetical protein MTO96_007866 [Rhipicephalus appendiculatus]